MQIWEKEGLLDIRVPATGDEDQIDAICRDYRIWLDQHQGSEIAYLKAQGNKVPFFDESYASQIKKDVKKNRRASESQGKPDFLFLARIFLQTAQELDVENWGINPEENFEEIFSKTFLLLSSKLHDSPAYLAEYTPGSLFNASISRPVSSAKQFTPYFS